MPTNEVAPLAEAQIENAARALALAFQDDPLQCYVLPDPEERARRSPPQFATFLRYGHLFGEVYTTPGAPAGVAIWQPPGAEMTPEQAVAAGLDRLSTHVGPEALQRFGRVLGYLEEVHHRELPPEHWYLMIVGVLPARQRQGLGRALLQPILDRADAARRPCCLDTAQPQSLPFYQKLGFRILEETVEPDSGLRLWTFRRDPP